MESVRLSWGLEVAFLRIPFVGGGGAAAKVSFLLKDAASLAEES